MPLTNQDPYLIDQHKMIYHPERVAQWLKARSLEEKQRVYPIYVEVSPVGNCNHRCVFCAVDYIGYKARRLDTTILSERLAEMGRLGVKSVMFAGEGEPLLHKDIDKLVIASYEAGIDCSFTTNGVLLDKLDGVLDKVSWIKISMNGGQESYAKVHKAKPEDYERVWTNVGRAIKNRVRLQSMPAIGLQVVVLPDNITDLQDVVKRAAHAGVDYVVLKPYSQHKSSITTKYALLEYSDAQVKEVIQECKKYSTDAFKVVVRENAMNEWDEGEHRYEKCLSTPYFWAYIMATGDVYGCSAYLLNDKFCYGNIGGHSFEDIWLGEKRKESIGYLANELDISQCRVNCRMNQVNKYLDDVAHPNKHANFI